MDTHIGILTADEIEWRDSVRNFARRKIAPGAQQRSLEERFDDEACEALAEMGYFGLLVSESNGGSGAGLLHTTIAYEALAEVDFSVAVTLQVQGTAAHLLELLKADACVDGIVREAAAGKTFVAVAISEPQGGSDMRNIQTILQDRADGTLILSGTKQFVTNSGTPRTKYHLVLARRRDRGPAIVLVPRDLSGVNVGGLYRKSGWRASDTHPVFYDDAVLPARLEVTATENAYKTMVVFFEWARILFAGMCVGLAQACIDQTIEFVRGRTSFGAPLGQHQAVSFTLADMQSEIESARSLVYRAARSHEAGANVRDLAAMAKLKASETAQQVAARCCQLHGGYAFIKETPINRLYLDTMNLTVGEGTSEMMKLIVSRVMGLK